MPDPSPDPGPDFGKDTDKGNLPGNHGQFGAGDATEAFKPLEDHPAPADKPASDSGSQGPKQTNAGERS